MIPTPERIEELKRAAIARGTSLDVVATLETALADQPRQLAWELIALRDEGTLKQRLERAGLREREHEELGSDFEANRPDPIRQ